MQDTEKAIVGTLEEEVVGACAGIMKTLGVDPDELYGLVMILTRNEDGFRTWTHSLGRYRVRGRGDFRADFMAATTLLVQKCADLMALYECGDYGKYRQGVVCQDRIVAAVLFERDSARDIEDDIRLTLRLAKNFNWI